jgi:hypothetical protein
MPVALKSTNQSPQPERIYISRRLARGRKFINENEVIEVLEQFGFTTIDAELMSETEKISLLSGAKVVAGIHGAGLTNLVYSPAQTKVIEIFPVRLAPPIRSDCIHYYWISYYRNLEYSLIKADIDIGSLYLRELLYGNDGLEEAILDINGLKAMLRTIGLT